MVAGEKLVGSDGKEVMLFPLSYMYISQGENESFSHAGILAIDFLGWGENGRINRCPYYAPCKCKLIYQQTSAYYNIWESVDKVHTPIGLTYVSFWVQHDNTLPYSVGTILEQGDLLGRTGDGGYATGDHLHFNTADSKYEGQVQMPPDNNWELKNSQHIYDICYVNNTVLVNDYNYNWKIYSGGITPSKYRKGKFPWVLYSRRLRDKRT